MSITVTVSLFFLLNAVTGNNSPEAFPRIFWQLQLYDLMVFEFKMYWFRKERQTPIQLRQETEICNFGVLSPLEFLSALGSWGPGGGAGA